MNNKIEAHKITKPIQLLAAWLVGLAIVNITFLTAATKIITPDWVPALLSIASVINVPIFVFSIFLLQTKYRPEMQEDSFYSEYLGNKSNKNITQQLDEVQINLKLEQLTNKITDLAKNNPSNFNEQVKELISEERIEELSELYGGHRTLSELYLRPDNLSNIINTWGDDKLFKADVTDLLKSGLASKKKKKLTTLSLTKLGKRVANRSKEKNILFSQVKPHVFR